DLMFQNGSRCPTAFFFERPYSCDPCVTQAVLAWDRPVHVGSQLMAKIKLTQRTLETLKAPATGRAEYRDEFLPNFVLRVTAAGRKTSTYLYSYHGGQKR